MGQWLPQDLVDKVSSFIIMVRRMCCNHQYQLSMMGNMDETPLWLDMPGNTTVASLGNHAVPIHTTGHDKERFTIVLFAMADGKKLKPFVVLKMFAPLLNYTGYLVL